MLEIKARTGVDYRLWIWLPRPCKAGTNVALAVRAPVPFTAAAMTRVGITATVNAISADRRTLTLTAPAVALNGAVGAHGGYAWIKPDSGPAYQIQIVDQPTLSTLTLAEPLPQAAVISAAALSWEVYHALVTAVTATATAKRNVPWTVTWTSSRGASMPDETERLEGLMHVVRQPFQTGLTQHGVFEVASSMSVNIPRRQESLEPQIAVALRELERWLRVSGPVALGADAYNGAAFVDVHAMLVCALVLASQTASGMNRAEPRDDYRAQARTLFEEIMKVPPWLDADGDGVADSGEVDVAAYDATGSCGGTMTLADPDDIYRARRWSGDW